MVTETARCLLSALVLTSTLSACGAGGETAEGEPTDVGPVADGGPLADATMPGDALQGEGGTQADVGPASGETADAGPPPASLADALDALGAAPCPDLPEFFCARLPVPLDHAAPDGPTLSLAFAVRPASGLRGAGDASLGVLLNVSGGPGYGGLAEMDDLAWIDPAIREAFDMVYFDLRGVEGSGGFDCPRAAAAWYAEGLRAVTPSERASLVERAARFATDCPAEIAATTGVSVEAQAFHDTTQAAHDLEVLRRALGGPRLTLSGISYGTQLSQTYATLYPEHVRAVILDGAIDLTRRELEYVTDLAAAVQDVVARTLSACDTEPDCRADFAPGTALEAYAGLAARLDAAPLALDFPLADGTWRPRTVSRVAFDHLTTLAASEETLRSLFLRALAAADRGAFVPLRRLLDAVAGIDEATEAVDFSGFSDAAYYTITCNDYGRNGGGPEAFVEACVEATDPAFAIEACFGDLPCATWPTAGAERPRPPPFAPAGMPVLVINADADTATPVSQGRAVVDAMRAAGATVQAVSVGGGHHVMWGSDACVDAAASAFLFEPTGPSGPTGPADPPTPRPDVTCEVGLLGFVFPLTPSTAAAYDDATTFVAALTTELYALPWFPYASAWGCDFGGAGEIDEDGLITLDDCSFVQGVTVDGTGVYDWEAETVALNVTVRGEHTGRLESTEDAEGDVSVRGLWDGAAAE